MLAEVAPVEPRKSPKECPVATPEVVVPVYTAKPLNNSPVRSLSIGLSREPDHSPVLVVLEVINVPSAKYTGAALANIIDRVDDDVEPIAFHATTEPSKVAPPAWAFTKLL